MTSEFQTRILLLIEFQIFLSNFQNFEIFFANSKILFGIIIYAAAENDMACYQCQIQMLHTVFKMLENALFLLDRPISARLTVHFESIGPST